jgi:plasmid replication initiation protein
MDSHPNHQPDVVQSNFLIRSKALIGKNKFTLSLIQKRVIYYILREIYNGSKTPKEDLLEADSENWYRLHVKDMINQINPSRGGRQNDTLSCLGEIDRLRGEDYQFKVRWKSGDQWVERNTQWILETNIKATTGYFDVHIPSVVVELVRGLDGYFTELPLQASLKLKSYNQVRLYELLLSYSYKQLWEVSIKELREFLEMKDDSYPKFSHFKKWVLDKSIQKINEVTNLNISYEIIKTGITPINIKFKIKDTSKERPKKELPRLPEVVGDLIGEYEPEEVTNIDKEESIYPHDLEKELKRRSAQIYNKYKGKPMPEEIWWEVLRGTDLKDSALVSEAVKRRDAVEEENKKGELKKVIDRNVKVCSDYWDTNKILYEEPSNQDQTWIQMKGGKTILFKDYDLEGFKKFLEPYLKKGETSDLDRRTHTRREKKSLIGGTSDSRRVDRRS